MNLRRENSYKSLHTPEKKNSEKGRHLTFKEYKEYKTKCENPYEQLSPHDRYFKTCTKSYDLAKRTNGIEQKTPNFNYNIF